MATEARKKTPPRRTLEFFERSARNSLLEKPKISTPVVMAALVYLERARPHIVGVGVGQLEDHLQSVFLGAMIVASKVRYIASRDDLNQFCSSIPWTQH